MDSQNKLAIVFVCLNGKNYSLREFTLRCFIMGQKPWDYVDGIETRPRESKVEELKK